MSEKKKGNGKAKSRKKREGNKKNKKKVKKAAGRVPRNCVKLCRKRGSGSLGAEKTVAP